MKRKNVSLGKNNTLSAQIRHVKHPFSVIVDNECEILILGSVPSVQSVEYNFYYMNPTNRFWRLMSELLGEDFINVDSSEKTALLLKHHVALYDSVKECDIVGSSDMKITNVTPADIPAILQGTNIRHIFCNGTAALKYLVEAYPNLHKITTLLPSTSSANARYQMPQLLSKWSEIKDYIC